MFLCKWLSVLYLVGCRPCAMVHSLQFWHFPSVLGKEVFCVSFPSDQSFQSIKFWSSMLNGWVTKALEVHLIGFKMWLVKIVYLNGTPHPSPALFHWAQFTKSATLGVHLEFFPQTIRLYLVKNSSRMLCVLPWCVQKFVRIRSVWASSGREEWRNCDDCRFSLNHPLFLLSYRPVSSRTRAFLSHDQANVFHITGQGF